MALLEGQVYTYMCEEIIIIGLIICKKGINRNGLVSTLRGFRDAGLVILVKGIISVRMYV